jgi:hypothetical protein
MGHPEKTCFVISPIGEEGTEIRRRSDQILNHVIKPAAEECGYEIIRADTISEPGLITNQVIQHILEDALIVADLTGRNQNVFYELAIRHAIRKPLVQLIQLGESIPFDVSQSRTIQVDHHDLDSVAQCKKELIRQIKRVEKDPNSIDSPISVAIDLQSLRQSENPLEKSSSEIISMLQEIRSKIDYINEPVIRHKLPENFINEFAYRLTELRVLLEKLDEPDTSNEVIKNQLSLIIHSTLNMLHSISLEENSESDRFRLRRLRLRDIDQIKIHSD